MTPIIITKSDFVGRVELPTNLGDTKYKQHILHAEDFDLRKLMGDKFYFYFMSNFNTDGTLKNTAPTAIKDLYDGSEYTVDTIPYTNAGIKPVLVYFTASRLIKGIDEHITPNGFMDKTNEFSQQIGASRKSMRSTEYENQAIAYWNMCLLYMGNNKDLFPKFYENECGCGTNRGDRKRPTTIAIGGR